MYLQLIKLHQLLLIYAYSCSRQLPICFVFTFSRCKNKNFEQRLQFSGMEITLLIGIKENGQTVLKALFNQDALLASSFGWPLLSPFSWPMKMATTKASQEAIRARHSG